MNFLLIFDFISQTCGQVPQIEPHARHDEALNLWAIQIFPNFSMSAIASTIFKIRAHSDFVPETNDENILSFRKGQPFYALSTNIEKGYYFVSTQFAVPFSRTAVCGMVPMSYFEKVDLFSKDPPFNQRQLKFNENVSKISDCSSKKTMPFSKNDGAFQEYGTISYIRVLTIITHDNNDYICMKLNYDGKDYEIQRSATEFNRFSRIVQSAFPDMDLDALPPTKQRNCKLSRLEHYLNQLVFCIFNENQISSTRDAFIEKDHFFRPREHEIDSQTKDSDVSQIGNFTQSAYVNIPSTRPRRSNTAMSQLAMMVFGM
jgi:hypothetical protein